MAIRVALHHRTTYSYDRPIMLGPQVVRLRPTIHARTPVHSYSLQVDPTEHFCNWQQDPHGNFLARLVFEKPTKTFDVSVNVVFDMEVHNPFDFFLEDYAEDFPFTYERSIAQQLRPCLVKRAQTKLVKDFIKKIDTTPRRTISFLIDVNRAIQEAVDYTIRLEPGIQTPHITLKKGSGSCRDSAWLMCQVLRHFGLATRFVSGYLIQLVADKTAVGGPSGPAQDFTDLHAWCEVFLPGAGWVGLDPTSGLLAGEGHIPLACSPLPSDAAPISGSHEVAEVEFAHHMSVERLRDIGRPMKPYSEEEWQKIYRCGLEVDDFLQQHDVRLSSGGEPTFVSSENPDEDEWNTAALGMTKHFKADALLQRLRDDWAPGAVLQHGQGKWYPGEELPRWAYSAYWRKDAQPLWKRPDLFAEIPQAPINANPTLERKGEIAQSQALSKAIARELSIDEDFSFLAFEDPWHLSWQARRFPVNIDPLENKLANEGDRARVTKILRGDPQVAAAVVLPLSDNWAGSWRSGKWFLREEQCYLMPGDSPAGFRLPLDGLPWLDEGQHDPLPDAFAQSPLEQVEQPSFPQMQAPRTDAKTLYQAYMDKDPEPPTLHKAADPALVRAALVVEARDGIQRIFLPPTQDIQAWLHLIEAIERAVEKENISVLLEGYAPPHHPDIVRLSVTPDPGVIEVNVPPVNTWKQFVEQTHTLYDHAHQLHLSAEKFDIDGRHTGTGGGCHVTFGGPTPADSPLLRRPDVLGSFIRYFNNHPSLSYAFSGSFIGPTSQAPRIDEARQDALAEIELALDQLPIGEDCPPWLVDRVLRHLLVDVSGNTHRAEFCIDKLYSPDSSTGRLGLLEIRSYEMPPHWQLNCAQQLLLRTLFARFWKDPYTEKLTRWRSQIHDRWMLPYYILEDIKEVCAECSEHGFFVDPQWYLPHVNFRMPLLGHFVKDGVRVEVRFALEPWHVLGEENSPNGQARYVDSSLERIEIRVQGLTNRRHKIVCNGVELPLQETGREGEAVAGLRYRAWQPPSCLHPTIAPHVPLRIDLYDEWNQRALIAASYYVAHPGGLAHENRPINENEAEGRRAERFKIHGHTQGQYIPIESAMIPEQPYSLDLRRYTL